MGARVNRPDPEIRSRRELRLLEALDGHHHVTQRGLSARLGVALGLTNLYLKRLVRKGYIKCVNVRPNRVRYLVTPKGLAEKARLTYESMEHSLRLYRETRQHLRGMLGEAIRSGCTGIAICGTGDPAELAYISLKELGLEPVAVFDGESDAPFLGMTVRPLSEHASVEYDLMIVATLGNPARLIARLSEAGVPKEKLWPLGPPVRRPTGRTTAAVRVSGRPLL